MYIRLKKTLGKMKRKVVFVGFEKRRVECLSPDLKGWKRKYELIFSQYVDDALETIALMKREDDIRGLIFHRNVLMTSPTKCKIMVDFANLHQERNFYPDRQVCAINLMSGEKDKGVLDHAVSETFAQENDWIQVKKFLDSKTWIYKNWCSSRYFRRSFFIVRKK